MVLGSIRVEESQVLSGGNLLTTSTKIDMFQKENYGKKIGNRYDFGLNFGLSYDFTRNFFANARYTWGLTSVFEKNSGFNEFNGENIYNNIPKVKNSVFQIGVGVKF